MIRWILKGMLRDKSRSLFPVLVVTVGVALTVGLLGFMDGVFMGMIGDMLNRHRVYLEELLYEQRRRSGELPDDPQGPARGR